MCKSGLFTYGVFIFPFYYRRLAGNIPDVSTVKVYLKELELLGYSKVKVVKDRGFYSVENINALYKEHIKFVISVLRRPTRFPPESRKSLPKKPSISLRTISFKFTKGSFPVFSIWQIHPFCEGNTRSTAVFAIKYLRNFGFDINNEAFAKNSWYFRNALVRANYVNYSKNVTATPLFLERFFDNLLFGAKHELHNRDMHISKCQSDTENSPKGQIGPLDVTLEEKVLLEFVKANPKATQEQIAKHIGKSSRTVKRITASLYAKGYLKRENGKRNGVWITIEYR